MVKSLIVYASRHHKNTHKLVTGLAQQYSITLYDADSGDDIDFDNFDLIGFASGLDFGKFYPAVTDTAKKLPQGKTVYALYTCAKDNLQYGDEIKNIALQAGCGYAGKFGCKGYNTYGPLKLIGGMNKKHPDSEDIKKLCRFYGKILSTVEKQG